MLVALAAPAGALTLSDSSFNLAGYTQNGPLASGVNLTIEQCAACGPDASAALRVAAVYPTDSGSYRVALVNNAWTYDPASQGALATVGARVDKRVLLNFDTGNGLGNSFRPLIVQGGQLYAALLLGPTIFVQDAGWAAIAGSDLTAAAFTLYDMASGTFGIGSPDFAGTPMSFGLLQLGSRSGPFTDSLVEADYDNLELTLSAVPEPQRWALLAAGLGAAAGLVRRRRAG
jgi:hypothetical protein